MYFGWHMNIEQSKMDKLENDKMYFGWHMNIEQSKMDACLVGHGETSLGEMETKAVDIADTLIIVFVTVTHCSNWTHVTLWPRWWLYIFTEIQTYEQSCNPS